MAGMDGEDKAPRVALVAGATRGAGRAIAVELARAEFYVYATGRSSRTAGRSEIGRPETIEETGELMAAAGGQGTALVVDHEDPRAVADLAARVESGHGRLDVLVNDIFGGDHYAQWDTPMWEHDLAGGLRMLRMGVDTHIITAHAMLPLLLRGDRGLLVEMTDGTAEVNASYRGQVGFFYDLVKANVSRIVLSLTHELRDRPVTALGLTPGWLRSEAMLDHFGVTEATWRDAVDKTPGFAISESPTYVARGLAALAQDPDVAQIAGPASWPTATASPTRTAPAPTRGATSPPTACKNRPARTSSGSADLPPRAPSSSGPSRSELKRSERAMVRAWSGLDNRPVHAHERDAPWHPHAAARPPPPTPATCGPPRSPTSSTCRPRPCPAGPRKASCPSSRPSAATVATRRPRSANWPPSFA
jgi:NAD(P)-dependent dehydrogenase (short-subunit alcohol dehydrogenase family)